MTEGSFSKAETANPKDLLGAQKVSLTKLPAIAVAHAAHAMMNGASKYGPYNWRAKKVIASIYIDAAKRHLDQWFEGEEVASDSGVHHLGHGMACLAILLDALTTGNLIDDRPINEDNRTAYANTIKQIHQAIADTQKQKTQPSVKDDWADCAQPSYVWDDGSIHDRPGPIAGGEPASQPDYFYSCGDPLCGCAKFFQTITVPYCTGFSSVVVRPGVCREVDGEWSSVQPAEFSRGIKDTAIRDKTETTEPRQ